MKKKILSMFLSLCMIVTMFPVTTASAVDYVARVATFNCLTLQEAVNRAANYIISEEVTITLLKDITVTSTVNFSPGESKNFKLDLNGKKITGNDIEAIIRNGDCTLTIIDSLTGGMVNANGTDSIAIWNDGNETVNITGGTVSASGEGSRAVVSNGTVNITGGTVSSSGEGSRAVVSKETVNIFGGTVSAIGEGSSTIDSMGTVKVIGGTVSASGKESRAIVNNGTVKITGGTVSASGESSRAIVSDGTVKITGGTVSASGDLVYAIFNNGTGTVSISGEPSTIASEGIAINKVPDLGDIVKITASKTSSDGTDTSVIDKADINDEEVLDYKYLRFESAVARIGSTDYTTVQAAVNAATDDAAADGQTIQLLEDITLTSTVIISHFNKKNFTLDLNGKILNREAPHGSTDVATLQNTSIGILTITDSVTGGAVSISGDGAYAIRNTGTVNITGGTVSASGNSSFTIYVMSGTANITGGTVSVNGNSSYAIYIPFWGSVNISGGTVIASGTGSWAIYNPYSGIVNITGGTSTIAGEGGAINKGPDLSDYANVKITTSKTAVDGTAASVIFKDTFTKLDVSEFKYLKFEPKAYSTIADLEYSLTTVNYDGNPKPVSVTAVSGKSLGAITVKYNNDITEPIDAGTYNVTVDITETEDYMAVMGLDLGEYTINKINYSGITSMAVSVYTVGQIGSTLTLPIPPTGGGYGTPTAGGGILMTDMSITGNTLTYTAPPSTDGQTATITIPVTGATNYTNYNVVVTITYTTKTPQDISYADTTVSKTYGDDKFTNPLTQTTVNGAITYASDDTSVATVNPATGEVTIVSSGSANITATAAETGTHARATASYTVNAAKKELILKVDNKTMMMGNALPAFTYTVTGLVGGDTVTSAVIIITTYGTTIGTFPIIISGGTVTNAASYHITYVNGTLTVTSSGGSTPPTGGGSTPATGGDTSTPTENEGKIRTDQRQEGNAPIATLKDSTEELKDKIFSAEEQEQLAAGKDAKVVLKVQDISASVSEEEKKKIEEKLALEQQDMAVPEIYYVDISLYKKVGEGEEVKVTNTSGKIKISIEVPDSMKSIETTVVRTYRVVRIHNGEAEILEGTYDPITHLFTFETDRFSIYALTYKDNKVTPDDTTDTIKDKITVYNDFRHLQLTAKADKTSQTLSYKKAADVDGYLIYGAKCGEEMKLLAVLPSDTTSYKVNQLKQKTSYKFQVKAYRIIDNEKVIVITSKTIHSVTESKTYSNPTKVTMSKSSVTLEVGKSKTVTGQVVLHEGKKLKEHTAIIRYESSNKKIATVNSKGKITAKVKGTCYVYAYAQNGVYKRIKVTVE